MKSHNVLFSFTLLLFMTAGLAQEKAEPQFKLVEFQMVLLKKGPNWSDEKTPEVKKLQAAHFAYFQALLESGKAVIGGPLTDEGEIRGIYVLRPMGADKEEAAKQARGWAEDDPAVKSGYLALEIVPWWSEEVMKKANSPISMTTAYLGFLTRGDKWTPERTPQTEELQKAHLANIRRLAEMKKLVVAGPFGGNGRLRGIFVFRVDSLEEAKTLADTDPAVQAGRLAISMHPWLVPDGILP